MNWIDYDDEVGESSESEHSRSNSPQPKKQINEEP